MGAATAAHSSDDELSDEKLSDEPLPPSGSASFNTLVRQLDEPGALPGDWGSPATSPAAVNAEVADADGVQHPLQLSRGAAAGKEASYETLLAPPSYADTVFDRGEIEQAGAEDALHLTASHLPSGPKVKGLLRVQVTDPIKRDDASSTLAMVGKKYVEYLVTTDTTLPGFAAAQFSVRRRFRDIVTLAEVLADSHRGYFLPQRPEKTLVEGQLSADKEFVEERRLQLERYLNALAEHPVLRHSAELRTFLESEAGFATSPMLRDATDNGGIVASAARQLLGGGAGEGAPGPAAAATPPKASRDFLRVFKEMRHAVAQSPVISQLSELAGRSSAAAPTLEDDTYLTHKVSGDLHERDRHLSEASKKAELLVLKQQAHGDVLGELGMAMIKLANYEDNEGVRRGQYSPAGATLCQLGVSARCLGRAAVRSARLCRTASAQTVEQLAPLHRHLAAHGSVRKALVDRTQALLTAQTLEAEAKTKTARLVKLDGPQGSRVFGGDKNHQKKVEDLTREIQATEASHRAAVQEYERIKGRNLDEWARLTGERQYDFTRMLAGFARVQAAYNERAASIWLQVAADLGVDVTGHPAQHLLVAEAGRSASPQEA